MWLSATTWNLNQKAIKWEPTHLPLASLKRWDPPAWNEKPVKDENTEKLNKNSYQRLIDMMIGCIDRSLDLRMDEFEIDNDSLSMGAPSVNKKATNEWSIGWLAKKDRSQKSPIIPRMDECKIENGCLLIVAPSVVDARWQYLSRTIACCTFSIFKNCFNLQNETFFIPDKCCHPLSYKQGFSDWRSGRNVACLHIEHWDH